jgi:hypothetical protein
VAAPFAYEATQQQQNALVQPPVPQITFGDPEPISGPGYVL